MIELQVGDGITPRELIEKWVEALRSDRFAQGTRRLKSGEGRLTPTYCCLGVLCELGVEHQLLSFDDETWEYVWSGVFAESSGTTLPGAFSEWLGFHGNSDPAVEVNGYAVRRRLTHLNDEALWGFSQIADAIEKTYLKETADV